jgi:hypothetical protein
VSFLFQFALFNLRLCGAYYMTNQLNGVGAAAQPAKIK